MKDVIGYTRERSKELADYLEFVCQAKHSFEGEHPLQHSSYNHIHLWKLEYEADYHDWINLEYKEAFVKAIFNFWRINLKQYAPYRTSGYRLYLYQDTAPTVSVVANTPIGCPYVGLTPVDTMRDVLKTYEGVSWKENFNYNFEGPSHKKVLGIIEKNKGSISKPSAEALGVKVGELRNLIINMGLDYEVNHIRKKHNKRPADFSNDLFEEYSGVLWERILPPSYQ